MSDGAIRGTKVAYTRASPAIHIIEPPKPCNTRARIISQYAGANINMNWLPIMRSIPKFSGPLREEKCSEYQATGRVAKVYDQPGYLALV
jgi:hypothetical protein